MAFLPSFLLSLATLLLSVDAKGELSFFCFTAAAATSLLIFLPTQIFRSRLRKIIKTALLELLIIVCIIDCYCQEFFGTPISQQIISSILLTNAHESKEFISNFVELSLFTKWRIDCLLLLLVGSPFIIFRYGDKITLCKTAKYIAAAAMALCLMVEIPSAYRYSQLFRQNRNLQNIEGLVFRNYDKEMSTPLHRLVFACYSQKLSSNVLNGIKQQTFSAKIDSCSHLSPHIVLVIGESYNKHHSSLYGYTLQTTPLQQQRSYNGELFVFQDVVTPWNLTSNAFFDFFSVWEYGMKGEISAQPLFPTLFREAGYSVTFFSNQYALRGMRKGVTTQVGRFFLSDKDISDSMFDFRNSKPSKYDSGLVNQLEDFRKDNGKADYTLDIIHLIGQHFKYEERYPDTTARFSLEDYDNRDLDTEKKEVVMHYDNATCYNDMVLESIIRLHERTETIILFLSDHGEEVYDSLQISGRSFQKPTPIQARNEFEIPMWIWCSKIYQQKHPDIIRNIQAALNKPFMSDGLPQILLSLAGISCQWYDEHRNPLSPAYQPKKRIISGNVDYDKLMTTQIK